MLRFMNWIAVSSWVALFQSGSCVQNCQRDASSEHRTACSEQREQGKELRLKHREFKGRGLWLPGL